MKNLSPAQSFFLLILIGVALAGWFYGIHWKRVASGSLFSPGEREMIRLQDQITALTKLNVRLQEKIAELTPKEEEEVPIPPNLRTGGPSGEPVQVIE